MDHRAAEEYDKGALWDLTTEQIFQEHISQFRYQILKIMEKPNLKIARVNSR